MMRYVAVAMIVIVLLVFLTPPIMAWSRNMARQRKTAWREQEQDPMELDERARPVSIAEEEELEARIRDEENP